MITRLLRNGRITLPGATATASAMAIADDRIVWVGPDDGAASFGSPDEEIDLAGRLVTPTFVDAHIHVVQTGDRLSGLDLSVASSLSDALDRIAQHCQSRAADELILGQGWDETTWPERRIPTADELDRAGRGRRVAISRVDGHSAVASGALLAQLPEVEKYDGYQPQGRLERDAKRALWDALADLVPAGQRLAQARVAMRHLARSGVGAFHENAAPHIGPPSELALVRRAADEVGLHGTYYWGEWQAWSQVDLLQVAGLAGDLNADGAIGSHTAALRAPYADRLEHFGHAFLTPPQIASHVIGCTERGTQAGFHCIGDAALDAITTGFELAAAMIGDRAIVAARHRLEHCEMPSPDTIATLSRLGVIASVQPLFDTHWGGPDRMYADRVGPRWQQMNPFADLTRAGVRLAFGSDSPVTAPDPWLALRGAVHHRTEGQRLTPGEALTAHTRNGWYAARRDDAGDLGPRLRASYAVWDTTESFAAVLVEPDAPSPRCLRNVVDGRTIHNEEDW